MDKNNQNILYKNLDMLSVMESCDDNSVDLILVFMPPNMGGTVGESALRPFVDEEMINDLYKDQDGRFHRHINRRSFKNRQWDYGDCYFINEESFDAYMDMTKKVIQNAGRVLKKEGMLCFGIPLHFGYIERIEKDKTNFEMLLKQLFCSVGVMKVENFSTHENIDPRGYGVSTTYRLYFCTNGSEFIPINGVSELLRLPNEHQIYSDIYNSKERATKILAYAEERKRAKDRFLARRGPISVRHIFIPELRPHSLETCASEFSKEESFFGQQGYTEDNNMKVRIIKCASLPENITPLAESVMLTYCKEGDSALFPYDRDAQYASIADKLHIKWTALYKKSCNGYGGCGTDFLSRIPSGHYATYKEPIKQSCVKYRSNLVSSAADANQITKQLTEYTDLMSQVIQCASDNGWDNSGDMEDAVHALISLAVKSHAGSIVGDEAEKWFGEGWEQLSEPCRNYLQTAAAYDKISQQNGNADCAPIGIEYYRSLEYELNRTIVNNLFAYIKENRERVKIILENTEQSNDMKRIASTMSAILNDETVRGLTLGEIYQSLKAAVASSDEDVGSVIAECCRNKGYVNFLAYDNVSLLGMAAQLRNLCAHPSDIDDSFMSLNLQIVRKALKEQQMRAESQRSSDAPSVCAIIGPDNNKMKYPEDATNMKAAIKNLILMLYKSGIRQYASTGNSGFDLLVGEVLKECRQSGEAKSIKVVEYLPCERDKMKFAPNRKKRVLAIDKFATIEVCGDADNAANKGVCQEKALENAAFCIAFYAEDGQSAIASRVKDTMQRGTIVYNTYGII